MQVQSILVANSNRFPFTEATKAFETTTKGVGPDGKMAIKTISKY